MTKPPPPRITDDQREELERCLLLVFGIDPGDSVSRELNEVHTLFSKALSHWGKSEERIRKKTGLVAPKMQRIGGHKGKRN